jgi:hypothetical protein
MPHNTLKINPGVNQNRTLALNEASISTTNLVRFVPDPQGIGLVQKLGGWTKFFPTSIGSIIRALWAWEDTNSIGHLAVGSIANSTAGSGLSVITNNSQQIITPKIVTDNVAVNVTTVSGSSVVTITDTGSNISSSDSVYIQTQISVGGLILFGSYQCIYQSANAYQIVSVDALGNPLPATSSVSNGGFVPLFTIASGSNSVTVTLNNNGYQVGDTFPVLISTTAGGITISGNYIVSSIIDANNFKINVANTASSSATVSLNSGNARYQYFITPGALPTSLNYAASGFTYGAGLYGIGDVSPSGNQGTPISASDWTLDNWGDYLIACPLNGPIYQWDPVYNFPTASVIPQAPMVNSGVFVAMPQRQIIALGSTFNGIQDPLLIRWSDVDDFSSWIATVTNQAGSYRIPKGSRIVGGIQGPQQGLIWTDLAIWAMQYSGPPYVYQFSEVGTGCGLISQKAAASMNGTVYWMGQSQFFMYGSNGVQIITCPIWDVIFQDLDTTNLQKIRVAPNSNFGEISWYYPTKSNSGEINAYVKYNVGLGQWDFGTLDRTAWINQSIFGPPIGAATNTYIYQHETSTDADGQAMNSSFQTGYFVISEGEWKVFVDQIWPDFKWGYYGGSQNANILITFYVADYPGSGVSTTLGGVRTYGPYNMTQATTFLTPRFRGRLLSIKIESNDIGSFWRIGALRYRFEQDGKF